MSHQTGSSDEMPERGSSAAGSPPPEHALVELGLEAEMHSPELRPLVEALRSRATPAELSARDQVVERMADVLTTNPVVQMHRVDRGRPVIGRFSRRSVVLAAAASLAFGGVAAATTGAEPLRAALGFADDGSHAADDSTSMECPADLANHGEFVSGVARTPAVDGEQNHGGVVSEAAQSDCGKAEDTTTSQDSSEDPSSTTMDESTTTMDESTTIDDPGSVVDDETDTTMECPDDVKNHGEFVSGVAKDKDGSGDEEGNHGSVVSEAAKSDCGKSGDDADENDSDDADENDSDDADENDSDDGDSPGQSGQSHGNGSEHGRRSR